MDSKNGVMSSTSNQNNITEFTDELDLINLVDSDEPELRNLDQNDDKNDEKAVVKADVLSVILSKYGDDGVKLEEGFRDHNIEYKDLISLSDNDLQQFGVVDAGKRRLMLNDFSEMVNQNEYYDKELNELDVDEYCFDGLNNIKKHLSYLQLAITGSLLKLQLHQTEDVYVTNELNASELVMKTLEEMKKTSNLMEKQLLNLSTVKSEVKTTKHFKCWKFLLVLAGTAISSVVLFKYYRAKFFKL